MDGDRGDCTADASGRKLLKRKTSDIYVSIPPIPIQTKASISWIPQFKCRMSFASLESGLSNSPSMRGSSIRSPSTRKDGGRNRSCGIAAFVALFFCIVVTCLHAQAFFLRTIVFESEDHGTASWPSVPGRDLAPTIYTRDELNATASAPASAFAAALTDEPFSEWPNSLQTLPPLAPLRPIDKEKYTVRINTWRRNPQLLHCVDHYATCPGVAAVHIVWNDPENAPPEKLAKHRSGMVVVEDHTAVNSLNERFVVPEGGAPSTKGILCVDDDLFYPCEALDAGFFKWTRSPNRMVGYDRRLHDDSSPSGEWKYGFLSLSKNRTEYSITLTRHAFIHVDYLQIYTNHLPQGIRNIIHRYKNCEDIAMSYLVSSMTEGLPPLLADDWAMQSQIKLHVEERISGTDDHKPVRDTCVHVFALFFGLHPGQESPLGKAKYAEIYNDGKRYFPPIGDSLSQMNRREAELWKSLDSWTHRNYKYMRAKLIRKATNIAAPTGIVEGTVEFLHLFGDRVEKKQQNLVMTNMKRYLTAKGEFSKAKKLFEEDREAFFKKYSKLDKKLRPKKVKGSVKKK